VSSRGQLGHGELESEEEPREVEALAGLRMSQVSCGGWHCAVVSEEGDLYTWGWNKFGQLGVTNEPQEPKPKKVRLDSAPPDNMVSQASGQTKEEPPPPMKLS